MRYAHSAMLLLLTSCGGFPWIAVSDGEWDDTKKCAEKRSKWCLDGDEDGYGGLDRVPPPEGICEDKESSFNKGNGWDTSAGPYIYEEQWYYTDCNDCNDKNPDINPGAQDCRDDGDGADNDCSGVEDDQEKQDPCYVDADGDGSYTNVPACSSECMTDESLPDGANTDECNDGDATVYPGAEDQICADGLDSDCSGSSECAVVGNNVALSDASRKITHVASVAMREIDINSDGYGDLAVIRDASWSDSDATDVMVLPGSETAMAQSSADGEVVSSCGLTRDGIWAPQVGGFGSAAIVSDPSGSTSRYLYSIGVDGKVVCAADDDPWAESPEDAGFTQVGATLVVGSELVIATGRVCSTTSTSYNFFYWSAFSFEAGSGAFGGDAVLVSPEFGALPADSLDCAAEHVLSPRASCARLGDDLECNDLLLLWGSYDWESSKPEYDMEMQALLGLVIDSSLVDLGNVYDEAACAWTADDILSFAALGHPSSIAQGDAEPKDCISIAESDGSVSFWGVESSECPTVLTTSISAPTNAIQFGSSLSGAGDVNGDGYDDLLVGSTGAAYLYLRWEDASGNLGYGTPYGPDGTPTTDPYATIIDSSTADKPYEVYGDADLNGDGYSDFGVLVDGTLYLFAGGPP